MSATARSPLRLPIDRGDVGGGVVDRIRRCWRHSRRDVLTRLDLEHAQVLLRYQVCCSDRSSGSLCRMNGFGVLVSVIRATAVSGLPARRVEAGGDGDRAV